MHKLKAQHKTAQRDILLLSGGIGGAKLVAGFADCCRDSDWRLHVAVNTGDDFEYLGLHISPDIDTLCYTLSGLADPQRGWGRRDESWHCLETLRALGAPHWFQLGDRDLALHLWRSQQLREGKNLAEITRELATSMGVENVAIMPVSNDPIRTCLEVDDASAKKQKREIEFQDYFVRQQCQPVVSNIYYRGADKAVLLTELDALLYSEQLAAIVITPSNPFLSIAPMLAVAALRERLAVLRQRIPVLAISPLIAGEAVKGPTAKLFRELKQPCNAQGVADYYADVINTLIIDTQDEHTQQQIQHPQLQVLCRDTLMNSAEKKRELAQHCIDFIAQNLQDEACTV